MEQILIQETNFEKARKLIKENSGKKIIFSSNDDELNRKILEKENIDILLLNQSGKRDFHRQRDSGFNHVLAKLAKKKDITIGINLDELINSTEKEKSAILARIKQNVAICNKNKLKMKFISKNNKRDILDLKSLGLVLGMPTNMIKEL
ncbi:MAG: RNase P subunit p30 family protein [Nanoarchaeota archaeon]